MSRSRKELIESCRSFAQKNKLCLYLSVLYLAMVIIISKFFTYYRYTIYRLLGIAALCAAIILITSYAPMVYNTDLEDKDLMTDEAVEAEDNSTYDKTTSNSPVIIDSNLYLERSAVGPLREMLEAAKHDGVDLNPCISYVDDRINSSSNDDKKKEYIDSGYSFLDAVKYTEISGDEDVQNEYEHVETVDFWIDASEREAYVWLRENSLKYGFVIYDSDESNVSTGIVTCRYSYIGEDTEE